MSRANIWEILGIEPTTERGEIKKAYHQRLPLHHPEEDPEGFRQLREAFDTAIEYAATSAYTHHANIQPDEVDTEGITSDSFSTPSSDLPLNDFDVDGMQVLRSIYQQGVFFPDYSDSMLHVLNEKYKWSDFETNIREEFGSGFAETLRIRLDRAYSENANDRILQIEKFYAQNDLYEAFNILAYYLEKFPSDAPLRLLSVRLYYDLGYYAQVLEHIDAARAMGISDADLEVYRTATEACLYGINDERLVQLEKVILKAKKATIVHELLRDYYWGSQWKKMADVADVLVKSDPSVHNIACRGVALAALKKEKKAKKDFLYVMEQLKEREAHDLLNKSERVALAYAYYHFGFWRSGTLSGLLAGEKRDLNSAMENAVRGIRVEPGFYSLYELVLDLCSRSDQLKIPEEVARNANDYLLPSHPELAEKVIQLHQLQNLSL
ncbi:MAG: hypothetical protein LBU41_00330 [Clostridiales Family XIII bacterium]|jgi:hypothetical protein|nr:hypothetical protein [Clostridiales Family XIII bacterium]